MEVKSTDSVLLSCAVLTNDDCKHTVEWLYDGDENDLEILKSRCYSTVTVPTLNLNLKSKYYESLKCKVTDDQSGNTLLYDVCSQFSCEETGTFV